MIGIYQNTSELKLGRHFSTPMPVTFEPGEMKKGHRPVVSVDGQRVDSQFIPNDHYDDGSYSIGKVVAAIPESQAGQRFSVDMIGAEEAPHDTEGPWWKHNLHGYAVELRLRKPVVGPVPFWKTGVAKPNAKDGLIGYERNPDGTLVTVQTFWASAQGASDAPESDVRGIHDEWKNGNNRRQAKRVYHHKGPMYSEAVYKATPICEETGERLEDIDVFFQVKQYAHGSQQKGGAVETKIRIERSKVHRRTKDGKGFNFGLGYYVHRHRKNLLHACDLVADWSETNHLKNARSTFGFEHGQFIHTPTFYARPEPLLRIGEHCRFFPDIQRMSDTGMLQNLDPDIAYKEKKLAKMIRYLMSGKYGNLLTGLLQPLQMGPGGRRDIALGFFTALYAGLFNPSKTTQDLMLRQEDSAGGFKFCFRDRDGSFYSSVRHPETTFHRALKSDRVSDWLVNADKVEDKDYHAPIGKQGAATLDSAHCPTFGLAAVAARNDVFDRWTLVAHAHTMVMRTPTSRKRGEEQCLWRGQGRGSFHTGRTVMNAARWCGDDDLKHIAKLNCKHLVDWVENVPGNPLKQYMLDNTWGKWADRALADKQCSPNDLGIPMWMVKSSKHQMWNRKVVENHRMIFLYFDAMFTAGLAQWMKLGYTELQPVYDYHTKFLKLLHDYNPRLLQYQSLAVAPFGKGTWDRQAENYKTIDEMYQATFGRQPTEWGGEPLLKDKYFAPHELKPGKAIGDYVNVWFCAAESMPGMQSEMRQTCSINLGVNGKMLPESWCVDGSIGPITERPIIDVEQEVEVAKQNDYHPVLTEVDDAAPEDEVDILTGAEGVDELGEELPLDTDDTGLPVTPEETETLEEQPVVFDLEAQLAMMSTVSYGAGKDGLTVVTIGGKPYTTTPGVTDVSPVRPQVLIQPEEDEPEEDLYDIAEDALSSIRETSNKALMAMEEI